MDNHLDSSKSYQLKLSELRNQVTKELVIVSGLLKEMMKQIKIYLDMPIKTQEKTIYQSILQIGECLNGLNGKMIILNNRIDYISKNFVLDKKTKELDRLQEIETMKTLAEDIPKNINSISILKKYYLEIVALYTSDIKKTQELTDFDCFKINQDDLCGERLTNHLALDNKTKPKVKKQGCFYF